MILSGEKYVRNTIIAINTLSIPFFETKFIETLHSSEFLPLSAHNYFNGRLLALELDHSISHTYLYVSLYSTYILVRVHVRYIYLFVQVSHGALTIE